MRSHQIYLRALLMTRACRSAAFIAHGSLSCATGLRELTLEADLARVPSILRQIASPHLVELTLKVDLATPTARRMLLENGVGELAQSLTSGVLAAARPRVSLVVSRHGPRPGKVTAEHAALLEGLAALREEGRLRIMAVSRGRG